MGLCHRSLSMPEAFNAAAVVARMGSHPTALSSDSRRIGKNCAFLAYPGDVFDGRDFISDALSAGAVGVFWEAENFAWLADWSAPNVAVPRLHLHVGDIADTVYHSPSEKLFTAAVTGTNGKTTVTHFAARLCGVDNAAVIGTLGAGFLGRMQATDNTTPDVASIHALLSDFSAAGAKAVFIEASSHGIAQKRLAGVSLNCAAFCNVGRDHTDYHGDLPSYWRTKAALLQTPDLQTAVLNADDDYCATLRNSSSAAEILSYGFSGKEFRFLSCTKDNDNWRVKVDGLCGPREFCFSFIGRHNVENFAAAALIAHAAGVNWDDIEAAAADLALPVGRLQRINPKMRPAVYVDFAHTPDALSAALESLSGTRRLLVFGCGGERDTDKRAEMGKLAASMADIAFVTDDNPRGENPAAIRAAIADADEKLRLSPGRADAIAAALSEANDDDVILIAGKGHEVYQEINGQRIPFSDEKTALACLAKRAG